MTERRRRKGLSVANRVVAVVASRVAVGFILLASSR